MFTTGIPAFSAFCATGVSAAPSCGRTTSTSGFCAIACSTCCAWESASAAWSSWKSRSSYCSAALFAFFEIAPSQPWSVGGTLAIILIFWPLLSVDVSSPLPPDGAWTVTVSVSSPLLQAATPTARSTAAIEMQSRLSDMGLPPVVDLRPSVTGLRPLKQDGAEDDHALRHLLNLGREVHLR